MVGQTVPHTAAKCPLGPRGSPLLSGARACGKVVCLLVELEGMVLKFYLRCSSVTASLLRGQQYNS